MEVLASEKGLSKNTLYSYKTDLDQFISFIQKKNIKTRKFKDRDIKEFISNFKSKGYEKSTVSRKISSLTHFFNFLLDEKVIEINPLRNFEFIKVPGPEYASSFTIKLSFSLSGLTTVLISSLYFFAKSKSL